MMVFTMNRWETRRYMENSQVKIIYLYQISQKLSLFLNHTSDYHQTKCFKHLLRVAFGFVTLSFNHFLRFNYFLFCSKKVIRFR